MTKLYIAPGACSFGAHVVLKALGVPHEIVKVPLRTPDSPIHQVNPLGRVPTLIADSGETITENGAILPFLGDLKPEAGLFAPAGSVERAQIQEWIGFLNSEVHHAFRPLNRPELFSADTTAHEGIRKQARERLALQFSFIEKRLTGKTWAIGERFTIADAYLGVFIGWLPRTGLTLDQFPAIGTYAERYQAHPAVKAASAIENAA